MLSAFSRYPSFLIFAAVVLGIVFTMVLMPPWIRYLKSKQIGQQVRDDGPQTHLVKQGTPTMGGLIMLVGVILAVLVIGFPTLEAVALMVAIVATSALGFIDDISSIAHGRSLGLTPKQKLIGQFIIAIAFLLIVINCFGIAATIEIPFIATLNFGVWTTVLPIAGGISVPWLYVAIMSIVLVGLCNAVNLTDGLDGLAAGTVTVVMIVMAAIAYRCDMLSAAILAAAIAGACIGFLWFNAYPADIFMGDTGSLALGTALGCLAVITKTEFTVLIIGGLFVAEALSVMIQVLYFKKTRKRVFLMAPLHHHFEKKGWSETKVVIRFWIISGVFAAAGFTLYFVDSLAGFVV